jgi:colanic acid/amylovoran biosynthesis glycosyltransferase
MNCPLGILAPDMGLPITTFIRRHMQRLAPGRTAVIARATFPDGLRAAWTVDGPVLDLARLVNGRLRWQGAHALARQFGVHLDQVMIRSFLKKHQVRVVMGEYLDFCSTWLATVQESGARFFAHAHGHDVSGCLSDPHWQQQYLRYNDAAGVITMSSASCEQLLRIGLSPSKVHVIPYGVDVPEHFAPRPANKEIRCIAVGRFVPQKAPILLLDSFRRAAEDCPALRLGYMGAGPLYPAAQEFICAFRLANQVTLHGEQPNDVVLRAMQGADIFLQHSITDPNTGDQEGLPVAVLEAMAHGLPVVSTRHAGIPEAVVEGVTGYLVDPGDTGGMAESIVALARDPGLRRRMGRAGWERARDCFTWQREREQLLEVLGPEVLR